jgi:hypothetical protein
MLGTISFLVFYGLNASFVRTNTCPLRSVSFPSHFAIKT